MKVSEECKVQTCRLKGKTPKREAKLGRWLSQPSVYHIQGDQSDLLKLARMLELDFSYWREKQH